LGVEGGADPEVVSRVTIWLKWPNVSRTLKWKLVQIRVLSHQPTDHLISNPNHMLL